MLAHATRRLPGFRFEVQAPPLAEALPRMDVAIFIGFAASGPIETPVAIESSAQFQAIFGDDAPLAWDTGRGTQIYAYLAPAVRAFFRNGGLRCWVVRVARRHADAREVTETVKDNCARANYFPVSGLARAQFDAQGNVTFVAPAFASARSAGSWSDQLRVSTALQTQPLKIDRVVQLDGPHPVFDLALTSRDAIKVGDLLRFAFKREGYLLLLAVSRIEPPPPGRKVIRVTGAKALWFERISPDEIALSAGRLRVATHTFERKGVTTGNLESEKTQAPLDFENLSEARIVERQRDSAEQSPPTDVEPQIEQPLTLDLLDLPFVDAPQPGALMRIDVPSQPVWMTVQSVVMHRDSVQAKEIARVTGQAVAMLPKAPKQLPSIGPTAEKLSFELWVRQSDEYAITLSDLGFASDHERFWGLLPTDEKLYRDAEAGANETPAIVWWRGVGAVFRFPLAGSGSDHEIFFPLAMSALPEQYQRPVRLPGTTLERDGLASFSADLFLDEALIESNLENFLSQSEFVRYFGAQPRALQGIHAAVVKDEATLIAVPDAVHVGWELLPGEDAPTADFDPLVQRPDWWHFLDCKSKPEIKLVQEPEWGNFLSCAIETVRAPVLSDASDPVNQTGTYTLSWTFDSSALASKEAASFILEESSNRDLTGAVIIYQGAATSFTIYGRRPGQYFYRVRTVVGTNSSHWSNGAAVRVTSVNRWRMSAETEYTPENLLAVQRALLRMCAARGDLFALMSLPEHYREAQTLEHLATLKLTPELSPPIAGVSALGPGEASTYSYGAIYHPWLVSKEENQSNGLRHTPPCGALAGTLAQRANSRGAWIAPANDVLRDVLTLFPPILGERRLSLQQAQVNLIRQEPRGFLSLSADTLSDDEDFRPINVRRLLMLLRRMAQRLGASYVFEPQSDTFRRLVERGFNAMLDQMFVRGAFAGATPASSFQVVTGESLNSPQSTEQGRFIVELRVAPSLPMTFLIVRFVQTGDRSLVTESRG